MKKWQVFFVVIAVVLLQGAYGNYIAIGGVSPDFGLVLVVAIASLSGPNRGLATGLVVGLLQDILFGRVLGLYALGKMLVGYFIGLGSHLFFRGNVVVPFTLTVISTMVYEIYLFIVTGILYSTWGLGFVPHLLKITLYNAVAGVLLYVILYRLDTARDES